MSEQNTETSRIGWKPALIATAVLATALGAFLWPRQAWNTAVFVVEGLLSVAPLVIPGILLAAWITASGADSRIARAFEGRVLHAVIAASLIGAVTPVCGVTVLPLMAGLLAAGIPLAPIMAFWLSSPITDPAMLATTAATLGYEFAVGKTVLACAIGLWGGAVTARFASRDWALTPLRDNGFVGKVSACACDRPTHFDWRIWKEATRRDQFRSTGLSTTRLILICLTPAFAAEYALNSVLQPESLTAYVGEEAWWAIPVAVFVGAPAYLDGYAALPLTRGLIDHGMSTGAAMAFLVSGGVISIWGAMAIFPVLRIKPFLLYLFLALTGSLMAGNVFGWVT